MKTPKDFFKKFNEIISPPPSQTKEEAKKRVQAAEINNNVLNVLGMTDFDIDDILEMTKIMTKGQIVAADAEAKKYSIPNNIHMFDDPRPQTYKNITKDLYNWGKDVKQSWPDIQQRFLQKLDNDLNVPRKWNEVLNGSPFGEIKLGKPIKSIDSNGNDTMEQYINSKYKSYKNPLSKDNRIYTREDIGGFSAKEYSQAEPEIMAQWGKIGIPTNGELERERLNNGGTVYVRGYTRSDGVQVKPHYRAV